MRSFLTGSQVYGKPGEASDIDLVVQVSDYELSLLKGMADSVKAHRSDDGYGPATASLMFGKLNLVVTTDEATFAAWRMGTEILIEKKHAGHVFNRDDAVTVFRSLLAMLAPPEASEAVAEETMLNAA